MYKICKKCNLKLSYTFFGKHKIMNDGLRTVCKLCNNKSRKEYYRENTKKELFRNKIYFDNNKSDIIPKKRMYAKVNADELRRKQIVYRRKNKQKIKLKAKEYLPRRLALNAERRASKRTGSSIYKRYRKEIFAIYKNRPKDFHVDHIIPLKAVSENGEWIACGLHVPWNLQYLPAKENLKKHNRMP